MTKPVKEGDRVLLRDGREVFVMQAAQFDTIFEYHDGNRQGGWTDASLVDWNYSEIEWSALDTEVNP